MVKKKKISKKKKVIKKPNKKIAKKSKTKLTAPTLKLKTEHSIAMDFAVKVYKKFDKIIKSIILFGSQIKKDAVAGSDIDIIILIDDVAIKWDQELIAWYRQELDKILKINPYQQHLHINTVKLSTWWEDLMRGDPVIINILRNGKAMVDMAGFFEPLKYLLIEGRIKPSPEAIYVSLNRAPTHFQRSKIAELNAIEGLYWAMVDSAHAALIAANILPPSPEHIPMDLKQHFVSTGKLKQKYVDWFRELLILHKKINHKEITDLKGIEIDQHQARTQEFINTMAKLVNELVS